MKAFTHTTIRVAILLAVLSSLVLFTQPEEVQAAPWPSRVVYNIYATDGWYNAPDSTPQYIYGYVGGRAGDPLTYMNYGTNATGGAPVTIATGAPTPTAGPISAAERPLAGHAQLPGPAIYARVGDIVEVHLKNLGVNMGTPGTPNDPHTIHWHGIDRDASMDGVPETSVAALPANGPDQGAGNVIVYEFTESNPGTYIYHCHQEASIHVHMGMWGALVFYNPRDAAAAVGPGKGQGGQLYGFKYDADYLMILSETDPGQWMSELAGVPALTQNLVPFNPTLFQPIYWMINGLGFPNTIHASTNNGTFVWQWWIDAHPNYDPFIVGSASAKTKVLVRMFNIGFANENMHIHGFHPKILGMDQRPWTWANPPGITAGQGLEMNTFSLASGQAMELLIDFGTQRPVANYSTQTYSKINAAGAAVLNTDPNGLPMPDPLVTSLPARDYIGGPAIPNLFPWHNHDDYKATNFGIYPGGMFTMVQVNP